MTGITILDGGMGQELVARSGHQPGPLWATELMMKFPGLVGEVHSAYFAAGADIATANTYAIHRDRLIQHDIEDQFRSLHQTALEEARAARDANGGGMVAGALGPLGWSYMPETAPPPEEAAEIYREVARFHDGLIDLIILETVSGLSPARGALMGVQDVDVPVWLALSVDDDDGTKLRSGESVAEALPLIEEFGVAAVLINCSRPEAVSSAMPILAKAGIPFGGYANGFTGITGAYKSKTASTDLLTARTDLGPKEYADFAEAWVEAGATILGGCCETGPAHIAELKRRFG